MKHKSFSEALNEKITQLCLSEFPCGPGPWRSGNQWRSDTLEDEDVASKNKSKADTMSTESLQDLMESATFAIDGSLSADVDMLKKLATTTENPLTEKDLHCKLSSVRLVDEEITNIDDGVKKFKNLSELILSANKISDIHGLYLPPKLEVLELCGNKITNLQSLNNTVCSLLHLGVSYNLITSLENQLEPCKWKDLVSLDLSHNSIANFTNTVQVLQLLPKLRSVTLEGNAITLAAAYRGYIIDHLKELTYLDEKRVSADERHSFRGLSRLPGLDPEVAIINVEIGKLKGVKLASKEENDSGDLFPVKNYRYQIQYDFIREVTSLHDPTRNHQEVANESQYTLVEEILSPDEDSSKASLNTDEVHWQEEEIGIEYQRSLTTTDLSSLNNFFKTKCQLILKEHLVLVGKDPEIEEASENLVEKSHHGTNSKETVAVTKTTRQLTKTTLPAYLKDARMKGRGRDKQEEIDFYEINRTSKTVGKALLDLSPFVEGRRDVSTEIVFNEVESETLHSCTQNVNLDPTHGCGKTTQGDPKKNKRDHGRPSASGFSANLGAKGGSNTRGGKGDKGGKAGNKDGKQPKGTQEIPEKDENVIPPNASISFNICSWKTAREAYDWIRKLPRDLT